MHSLELETRSFLSKAKVLDVVKVTLPLFRPMNGSPTISFKNLTL